MPTVFLPPLRGAQRQQIEVRSRSALEACGSTLRFDLHFPGHWRAPSGRNPCAAAMEQEVLDWFAGLGCTAAELERVQGFSVSNYVGQPFPRLSRERTLLVGKFMAMWLLWDDIQVERLQRMWSHGLPDPDSPAQMSRFDRGWGQLFADLARRRSAGWMRALNQGMADWCRAATREANVMRQWHGLGRLPDFSAQLELRIATIGMYVALRLLEDACDQEFPDSFHARPAVRHLARLSNLLVGLGSDLFSLGKDLAGGQINLVLALTQGQGLSAEEAIRRLLELHRQAIGEYDALADEAEALPGVAAADVRRWLDDIRYATLGLTLWESQSPRCREHAVWIDGRKMALDLVWRETA
ncbi:hypothetical protein BI347_11880 [Chromobacterium sphagni]|uniref:Terpene synthase n=1 Tax=Chromobacterium sphagni TaxID=1903179 RepID=A0A1S1X3X6_9NEIS|nr:hypothetical protein BI347_11880 [Chromobacterium sphagni]